ncbi:MAG: hypothetical protein LBP53_07470 [Candidatus Peribacteria bacterium]|jgi:predicted PurR-regulated permease PerM|nr:hypothetical protein [Candidatus Peribacteria bacterium]
MMHLVFARVIIVVIGLLLLIFLRKFIRRLIFILILLAISFFMYKFFSPSGAEKISYVLRTFPQYVASFLGGKAVIPFTPTNPAQNPPLLEKPEQAETKEAKTAEKADDNATQLFIRLQTALSALKEVSLPATENQPFLPSLPSEPVSPSVPDTAS